MNMRRKQNTLESYLLTDRSETEEQEGAPSMSISQSVDEGPYYDLMERVIDDSNIKEALEKVVGNRGAPGVDGMTVHELEPWLKTNMEEFKDELMSGRYTPEPVRRRDIPKDSGGYRSLGIPTVKDRLVQQMIAQVLTPLYDPTFSDSSYGFRPGRSPIDAVMKVQEKYDEGYKYGVGIDLEKFFDRVQHEFLMNILRERIKDKTLIHLIKKFLRAGVLLPDGLVHATREGVQQGGPLSPLLSNIYLDKLDKELERRGHIFCRFADDQLILLKSPRATERVRDSMIRFIEEELKLKVNREKTETGSLRHLKFLGFKITRTKKGTGIAIHPKALSKFKKRVIAITKRNRGISVEGMLSELNSYTKGWIGYFGACSSDYAIKTLDEWMRRRVRQYIYKQWKKKYNRVRNLKRLCPDYLRTPVGSVTIEWVKMCWGAVRTDSYWHAAKSKAISQALTKRYLKGQGMYFLMDGWSAVQERWTNRRLLRGLAGGVRGQPGD
jgi:RNA-directed DNA polymerase